MTFDHTALDHHITGNYGEDQLKDETFRELSGIHKTATGYRWECVCGESCRLHGKREAVEFCFNAHLKDAHGE